MRTATQYWSLLFLWLSIWVTLGPSSLITGAELAHQLENPSKQAPDPFVISLRVELVVLDVTVLNKDGGFVSNLDKSNFQICENGQPQEIKVFQNGDVPVTAGLVVDSSGSMRTKKGQVIAAGMAFVELMNSQDQVFVVHFNETPRLSLPQGECFSNDPKELQSALSRMVPVGRTALYDSLVLSLEHLKNGGNDKKVLLVISDGGDNASREGFNEVLDLVQKSRVMLYSVALFDPADREQKPKVLKRLSHFSGGEFFSLSSMTEVATICRRVAHDIRSQYTLGYRSSNPAQDGTFRAIKVIVKAPGSAKFHVRTREGYVAAKESDSDNGGAELNP